MSQDTTLHTRLYVRQAMIKFPAGTWRLYNVASTSMQRHHEKMSISSVLITISCICLRFYNN